MRLSQSAEEPQRRSRADHILRSTLLFVIAALVISSTLVIYTAWVHDLRNGLFALLFAILSTQIALNWLLWKDDEDESEEAS
jgi:hypothetical protein